MCVVGLDPCAVAAARRRLGWPRASAAFALAQVNPRVGDLAGNAALVVAADARGRRRGRATSSRSPRWCSPATRSRTSRCGRRSRTRRRAALTASRPARREGLGDARRRGRLPRPRDGRRDALGHARAASRRTPPPCCTAAASSPATPSTTCPTTACSTSSATSCPATGTTVVRVARRRRGARHLRGPLAGRRPGRRVRDAGAGCSWSSTARRTSATRTTCGSTCAPAARARPAARSPT